ncbi:hypothetical protein LN449_15440 [Xanthomonas cannabis]|uniref:hypothetical protein n=1 Tax=Xanthomonas cannabis TaxID=1885674 RepID=UPI001E50504C|nr:hypothetical protein [Xanthomonas cannabis]MCC8443902.1 hypothetical protein [Xanthomonas cannabis]
MSNLEFLIHEVKPCGEVVSVSGIVNKGKVPLRAEFVSLRNESGDESVVSLKVSNIVAYRRQIDELPTGMSGELHLSGDGASQLAKHFMLTD